MRNIIKRSIFVVIAILFCYVSFMGEPLIVEAAESNDNEEFKFEVTVKEDDLTFYVPTSGSLGGQFNKEYSWNIDWGDGGEKESYTQANVANTEFSAGIGYTYSKAGTYEITITPTGSEDAWFGAFGFRYNTHGANATANKKKVTKVISPLTLKMTRTEGQITNKEAPNYEWAYTFYGCENITMGEGFNLPQDDIVNVGNYFAYSMFYDCSGDSFTISKEFNLPQGLMEAKYAFAANMFYNCSGDSFTMGENFNLPQGLESVGDDFANGIFSKCGGASFKMNESFNLPQDLESVGGFFAANMFDKCSGASFTMSENFNLPQKLTSVGQSFARNMFNECGGASFTMSESFNLPQDLVSIGDYFANSMFSWCSGFSFTMNECFDLPQKLTSVGNNFVSNMFIGCSGASFTMNENFNLPQNLTNIGNNFAYCMFAGCGEAFMVNDEFKFPNGVTAEGAFTNIFMGIAAPQYRTAKSIINGNTVPTVYSIGSFDTSFPDISYIDIKWGGEGKSYPQYGITIRTVGNVFPDLTVGYTDKGAVTLYIINLGTEKITGITPVFGDDGAAFEAGDVLVGDALADTIQANEWATMEITPKDHLNAGTHETNMQITCDDIDQYGTTDELEALLTIPLKQVVNKAIPTYTEPTGLTAILGQSLKDVTLPDGFTWKSPSTSVGDIGTNKFTAIFTPKDTTNYKIVEVSLDVTVDKTIDVEIDETVDKKDQSPLFITGVGQTLSFGKEVTLNVTGGSGSGKVSYNVTKGNEFVSLDQETGKLIATGIGTVTITATKAGDAACKEATAAVTFQVTMPTKNATVKVGVNKYKVTSTTNKKETLSYLGAANNTITKSTIPATIKIGTKSYKVTIVANNAFKNCKKLKSVTIGKNITAIGNNAFSGCTSLTKITIPANVKTIGTKAFYKASKLKNITVKSKKLTKIGKNAFEGIHKKAAIKVPSSKLKAYKRLFKGKGQAKSVAIKK